jgi:hypothetical protein
MFSKKTILFIAFAMLFWGAVAKNVHAADDCACAGRIVYDAYEVSTVLSAGGASACMNTCRTHGDEFYIYPDGGSYKTGSWTWKGGDKSRYTSNCACLKGSIIPLFYPVDNLNQAANSGACNDTCYAKSADYYAFDESGSLSGWKSKVSTPATAAKSDTTTTGAQMTDSNIPGSTEAGGIIQCGRPGQKMCTLCDMIKGFNAIIQYIMKIAIGVALLALAIGGVMYVVSAGESAAMETAKSTIKNAAIGFVIIFAAFLIVNTTMQYIGTIKNVNGDPTLGINITSWGQFDCTANSSR